MPHDSVAVGKHWITLQVNPDTVAGLRNDLRLMNLLVQKLVGNTRSNAVQQFKCTGQLRVAGAEF